MCDVTCSSRPPLWFVARNSCPERASFMRGGAVCRTGQRSGATGGGMKRFGWRSGLVGGLVLGLGVGGAVTWAAIPDSTTGTITACYPTSGPSQGALRVIDAQNGDHCAAG